MKRYFVWLLGLWLVFGCSSSKFRKMADASPEDFKAAKEMWSEYGKQLAEKKITKDPLLVSSFFSRTVLLQTSEADFSKRIAGAARRNSTGLFEGVEVKALKESQTGLMLVLNTKAGETGIPMVKEGERIKFAELTFSTGEWSAGEAKPMLDSAEVEPSVLFQKAVIRDGKTLVGERLKAAVSLANGKRRSEIIELQRTVTDPIILLGLGFARVRIDGFDENFIKNFPTNADGLIALAKADKAIFEEMITKLSNMGALVEDPPANEAFYRVVAGAPSEMRELMGRALYNMAELGPIRFANAVKNGSKDIASDPVLDVLIEEIKRRGGKSPQLSMFLKKFIAEGEPAERQLCLAIQKRLEGGR
jgi:hypothetical protein